MMFMQFFWILNITFKKLSFITSFIISFYEIFTRMRYFFKQLKTICRQPLWHCPTIEIIYIPIYTIWRFLSEYFIYLLLAFAYQWMAWHIPPLIPFSTINNISISVNKSNSTSVFFKAAYRANRKGERNIAVCSSKISKSIFLKFSKALANSNFSLWRYKSWYSPKYFYFKIFTNTFGMIVFWVCNIFHI